jgi:hypothetical protein
VKVIVIGKPKNHVQLFLKDITTESSVAARQFPFLLKKEHADF